MDLNIFQRIKKINPTHTEITIIRRRRCMSSVLDSFSEDDDVSVGGEDDNWGGGGNDIAMARGFRTRDE